MKHSRSLLGASAFLMLAACSGGDSNSQTAVEANQAAPAADNMAAMANDSNNPFGQAEMQMNERMMAAIGSDAGQNWAKKMIAHHQGAVDMSRIVLEQNPTADVAKMARETIAKNEKDMEDIRKLVTEAAPDQQSAELYRPAMMEMHQKMMAASGSDVSETYMRKMVEHHKGAVAMSDVALANGVTGTMREQVRKTRSENDKDAMMVEAMLRGEPMSRAMKQSGAKSAEQAQAEPAPAEKAKAAPPTASKSTTTTAQPKPKPATTPAKTEPDAPASTCLPEHRAAGHC